MPYSRSSIEAKRLERRKIGEQLREITAKAEGDKRSLNAEETEKFDKLHAAGEELRSKIELEEKVSGYDEKPSTRSAVVDPNADPNAEPKGDPGDENPDAAPQGADAAARAMRNAGKGPRDSKEYREIFQRYLAAPNAFAAHQILARAAQFRVEYRDLSVDSDTQAGYLVPPEQFVMELLKNIDDETIIRGFARKFAIPQAKSLGVPTRTAKAATWAWGTEIQAPTKDTTLAFGKRELHPKNAAGKILVSRDFLRQNIFNGETIVREEIARDGAELQENGHLTGTGAGQPLGIFTASADGIPTSRDVATGNAATAVTVDGLTEAKYALKPRYWPNARFIGSRTFHKQLYSMRDGVGRPLFVESLKVGEVDRIMGFPVHIDEFAPNTFTSGQYVGILGDFNYYWIADALDIEIQRLDELHADTNQVGFIARLKTDAMPVLAEAFVRVKLG